MADGACGPVTHMRGFCLKRNRDYRKANLVGKKYHRRWVELTKDTLIYAKSHSEVICGNIQVFAVHELSWARKEGAAKWSVRFPERILTFKVESGSAAERDRWVEALEAARELAQNKAEGQAAHAQSQLGVLQKKAEESLLNEAHSSNTTGGNDTWSISTAMASDSRAGLTPLRLASRHGSHKGRTDNRGSADAGPTAPLSPRSLLANARNGAAFVASPHAAPAMQPQASRRWHMQSSTSDSDDEEQQFGAYGLQTTDTSCPDGQASSRHVPVGSSDGEDSMNETTGSFELYSSTAPPSPTMQQLLLRSESKQRPQQQQQQQVQADQRPTTAGSSSSSVTARQLTRRHTPGIMLIDPSVSAISAFSSAAASPSSRPSSASPQAMPKQQGGILKRPASSASLPQRRASSDDDGDGDVLLLVQPAQPASRPLSAQHPTLAERVAPHPAAVRQSPLHAAVVRESTPPRPDTQHPQQPPEEDEELLVLDGPACQSKRVASAQQAQQARVITSNHGSLCGDQLNDASSAHSSRPASAAVVPMPPAGPPPAASRPAPRPPAGAPTSQRRLRPGGATAAALATAAAPGVPIAAARPAGRSVQEPAARAAGTAGAASTCQEDDWDADDADMQCNTSTQVHTDLSDRDRQMTQHTPNQSGAVSSFVTDDWDDE